MDVEALRKRGKGVLAGALLLWIHPEAEALTTLGDYPFAPAAGQVGSTAVAKDDPEIVGWASQVVSYVAGEEVDEMWREPMRALGAAEGDGVAVVSLGRGGSLTVAFEAPVQDGPGWDIAVFENAFGDAFLELAWVEVSSDGASFVRFPNYSATAGPVGAFGSLDPTKLYGYAGKYRQGFGTPFDLSELAEAYEAASGTDSPYSEAYGHHLRATFPALDLQAITHVRLVDVVGDGSARSAAPDRYGEGYPIYDPWPTIGSAGADIDAVAVRYFADAGASQEQAIFFPPMPPQPLGRTFRLPEAKAESGLAVGLRIVDAPDGVMWDEATRFLGTGTEPGTLILEAYQEGNEQYAPAVRRIEISVVEPSDSAAPESFADWAERYGIAILEMDDSDADGFTDWLEYVSGTHPRSAEDRPLAFEWRTSGLVLRWKMRVRSMGTVWPMRWNGFSWVPLYGDWPAPQLSASGAYWTFEVEVPWVSGKALTRLHAMDFENVSAAGGRD